MRVKNHFNSGRNVSLILMETGFFWSIFFSPGGPVLRYFGWLLFLIGFVFSFYGRTEKKNYLSPISVIPLLSFIIWGGIACLMGADDIYVLVRGFSIPLEFVFGIWIASRILPLGKNLERFKSVLTFSVITSTLWTLGEIFFCGTFDGPFSNINTLGLYSSIITPLCFSIAFSWNGKLSSAILSWISVAGGVFMLILSFSTSAWLSGSIALMIVLFGGMKHISRGVWLRLMAGALVVSSLFMVVISSGRAGSLERSLNREIEQIFSLSKAGSLEKFTNHRSVIWQGTWKMIKMKPVAGWGWHLFRYRFREFNPDIVKKINAPLEAHNMYLEILFNGGFLNLFLLLWIWLLSMKGLWRYRPKDPFALGMFATLAGLLVFSMAGNVFASRDIACIVWAIIGFGLIVPRLDSEPV